ncbi:MAG: DUF192 domain-containing protein [Acidobacteriaceae bacterium]|nr:DUF192 domain-containing protein [Acidobacteriaceae bacterium]
MDYTVANQDRGSTIGTRVRIAGTSAERRKGLLELSCLEAGTGLWITPCEAIHTFGMKMPIDAMFLDRDYRVRKLVASLLPTRISICLSACSVLELPAGTILRSATELGDRLRFQSVSRS